MPFHILLILGALSAFGPLAIDFYLPSFPAIAAFYQTDVEHVGLSLSAYFVGIALGQLIYGPLIDRFGRRKPLLIGISLFSLASIACAFAPSLTWLVIIRFVQSLGGCAGMVISRSIVRDKCNAVQAARVFSQLMLVTGLAPMLAPLFGGWILLVANWQMIFLCLCVFGALCALASYFYLDESIPYAPLPLTNIFRRYLTIARDKSFITHTLTSGLAIGGMFAYVAGSPFVFIELYHLSEQNYGWIFAANAGGFIVFGQINARLVMRKGPAAFLLKSLIAYVCFSSVLLGIALYKPANLFYLAVPLFFGIASLGGILPNATACALANQGQNTGSASGLLGSIQFCLAALASALVGFIHNNDALAMCFTIFIFSLCALICALFALKTPKKIK